MTREELTPIWLKLEQRLLSFINSKIKDIDVSKDILQEVFIKIHNGINKLRDHSKIVPWIYQITNNAVMDHLRSAGKSVTVLEQEIESSEIDHETFNEAIEDMVRMMDRMPSIYCDALCETEIRGLSQKEYAEKAGLTHSGSKARVQRAKKILRDMMMQCCHYEFDKYGTVVSITPNCCCCPQDH